MSAAETAAETIVLDGRSLQVDEVARVARDPRIRLEIAAEARERVRASRRQIDAIVERYHEAFEAYEDGRRSTRPVQDYGITTGFGEFKDVPIPPHQLEELQRNLLLSHAVGMGDNSDPDDPANYFSPEAVRATLVIRINAFLGGHSGVREELVDCLLAMLHRGIVPLVPTRGSMGSSGDLCPLSHLFNILLGEGRYHVVETPEAVAHLEWAPRPARDLPDDLGQAPVLPSYKEGLALSNGATVSTAVLALAVHAAGELVDTADVAAALSLEAICGCARAFDPQVHDARGHAGQITSAAHIRELVEGSKLVDSAGAVQDAYSIRCAPVVHGASRDTLAHVRGVVEREMNAATDNPLFFDEDPWDLHFADNWPAGYDGRQRASYSAGNFHGQPVALAADFLTIAVAELANISERRTQLLLDHHHNRNLPANLVARRGVNSGYMLAQYAAASLVTENKVLAHPASVDSIPTSANIEDHVAVATTAARKLWTVLRNVQGAVAIELLVATQAIDWRIAGELPPTPPLEAAPGDPLGRPAGPEDGWDAIDREARRFESATAKRQRPGIAGRLGRGTARAYLTVREVAEPVHADRMLEADVRRVRALVETGALVGARRSQL